MKDGSINYVALKQSQQGFIFDNKALEQLEKDTQNDEYDRYYEEMKAEKEEYEKKKKENTGSRYLGQIEMAAQIREREQWFNKEKVYIKQQKREGAYINQDNKFITESYRKKQEEEEEYQRKVAEQNSMDKKNSVSAVKGFKSFYQNQLFGDDDSKIQEQVRAKALAAQKPQKKIQISMKMVTPQIPQSELKDEAIKDTDEADINTESKGRSIRRQRSRSRSKDRPKFRIPGNEDTNKIEDKTENGSKAKKPEKVAELKGMTVIKKDKDDKEKVLSRVEKLKLARERYKARKNN